MYKSRVHCTAHFPPFYFSRIIAGCLFQQKIMSATKGLFCCSFSCLVFIEGSNLCHYSLLLHFSQILPPQRVDITAHATLSARNSQFWTRSVSVGETAFLRSIVHGKKTKTCSRFFDSSVTLSRCYKVHVSFYYFFQGCPGWKLRWRCAKFSKFF